MRSVNIGLSDEARAGVSDLLNIALATENLLLIKTKKIHWDIVGPQFMTLHKLLDDQYEKIAEYVDKTAERARQLGTYPIGTAAGFLKASVVKEHPGQVLNATDSVATLCGDHETVIRTLRQQIEACDEKFKDAGTADFLTGVMEGHEEMAWMLRSFLEGEAVRADGKLSRKDAPNLA